MNDVRKQILPFVEALARRHPDARLPPAALAELLMGARFGRWSAGDRLIEAGTPVTGLLFLLWGSIELDHSDEFGGLRPVGQRHSPDVYGDRDVIDGGVHAWGAVATAHSLTAHLPREIATPALLEPDPLGAALRRLLAASMCANTERTNRALRPFEQARPAAPDHRDRGHLRVSQLG